MAASVEVLEVAIVVAMVEMVKAKLTIVDVADDPSTLVLCVFLKEETKLVLQPAATSSSGIGFQSTYLLQLALWIQRRLNEGSTMESRQKDVDVRMVEEMELSEKKRVNGHQIMAKEWIERCDNTKFRRQRRQRRLRVVQIDIQGLSKPDMGLP